MRFDPKVVESSRSSSRSKVLEANSGTRVLRVRAAGRVLSPFVRRSFDMHLNLELLSHEQKDAALSGVDVDVAGVEIYDSLTIRQTLYFRKH